MTGRRRHYDREAARREKARLRKEQNMTEEERLADYRRRRTLLDQYVLSTSNVKMILLQRRKELEGLITYFIRNMTLEERQTNKYLDLLFYKQGVFDGRLHQLRFNFFQEVRALKPALVKAGIDKADKIEAELTRIEKMFQTLKENSNQFSAVLHVHYKK